MNKTAVVFSPRYYGHDTGRGHPESARRLHAIVNELKSGRLSHNGEWRFVEPKKGMIEDVELVHSAEYVQFVKAVCDSGGGILDSGDTVVSSESFDVALLAAGGALEAVDLVRKERFENAFVLARPPGHHAERFRALGFCLFNNVAIAAEHLLRKSKLKRILILDIDAHHGNGTQEIFYGTDNVLYVSLHEDPSEFPGTGFADEVGEGEGLGYSVNVPLPFGTSAQIYLRAVKEIAVPIIRQYRPQFILVSAGLDAHYADPVGNLALSLQCYDEMFATIVDLASETCNGRVVAVLEGGYSLKYVGKIAASAIARMSRSQYAVNDRVTVSERHVRVQGEKIIEKVKNVQRSFWGID